MSKPLILILRAIFVIAGACTEISGMVMLRAASGNFWIALVGLITLLVGFYLIICAFRIQDYVPDSA